MTKTLVERVTAIIEPILDDMAFELIDVEYLSERGRWVLRVTADKPGGITLNDCARISREVGDVIDVKDVMPHEYVLEVSSPGLNRPLKRGNDFLRVIGKNVIVKTSVPVDGRRNFKGLLQDVIDGTLQVLVEERSILLPLRDVQKASLLYDFARELGGAAPNSRGGGKRRDQGLSKPRGMRRAKKGGKASGAEELPD